MSGFWSAGRSFLVSWSSVELFLVSWAWNSWEFSECCCISSSFWTRSSRCFDYLVLDGDRLVKDLFAGQLWNYWLRVFLAASITVAISSFSDQFFELLSMIILDRMNALFVDSEVRRFEACKSLILLNNCISAVWWWAFRLRAFKSVRRQNNTEWFRQNRNRWR